MESCGALRAAGERLRRSAPDAPGGCLHAPAERLHNADVTAEESWAAALAEWALPVEITSAVAESPWTFPVEVFADRTRGALSKPLTPTHRRVSESLPAGGVLLDVGAGAGAASIPVAASAGTLAAVDEDERMLAAVRDLAPAGVEVRLVCGRWPDVAGDVGREVGGVDVVVCANVAYNVPDLGRFVAALTSAARRRVVLELTVVHPQTTLTPLWERFWGLARPVRPVWEDAVAVVTESTGAAVSHETWEPAGARDLLPAESVAWLCRRLCLPPEREPDVAAALQDLGVASAPPLRLVTLWWPGAA